MSDEALSVITEASEKSRIESLVNIPLQVDLEETDETPKIYKDEHLWFKDGSACIVAERSGYRIHRDFLSRLSEPLRDIFYEAHLGRLDVPFYYVSDSSLDMRTLLDAIYDGRKYLSDRAPDIAFSELSALMRLGHKYQLKDIIADAAGYLEDYYTPDFKKWMRRRTGAHEEKLRISESDEASGAVFEAVNIARLTSKPAILPLALYRCCQHSLHVLRCVSARDRLSRASSRTLAHVMHCAGCAPGCEEPDTCEGNMARLRATFKEMREDLSTADALAGLETQLGTLADLPCWQRLYHECSGLLVVQHQVKQRETWDGLLDILDLLAEELGIEWEQQD